MLGLQNDNKYLSREPTIIHISAFSHVATVWLQIMVNLLIIYKNAYTNQPSGCNNN